MKKYWPSLPLFFIVFSGMNHPVHARVLLRVEEAISRYYPDCKIKDESIFLTPEQIKKAEASSGLKIDSKLLNRKRVSCSSGEKLLYLDTHVVRTQKEVLMVVVGSDALERVELLSFYEPDEYIPGKKWYELFTGIKNQESVTLGKNIPHISGASLTSRATATAVKKIVSLHEAVKK